ncbi:hypothetical protein [Pseudomonas alloputida]|uniref:hypothetical protein n=1 Tax=Pseudomonas alloputida TaxID=1940621 RepID=UPI001E40370C|nr:hypothetical protein [Pseudomonas alloputida]MCE0871048.1 hypothetical protein [Pseudomonas alloputida]
MLDAIVYVVLLTDLMVHGDLIPDGTTLAVERSMRNDWKGSGLCRDATPEEIALYEEDNGSPDGGGERLAGEIDALRDEHEALGEQVTTLQGEVVDLEGQKSTLQGEVATLEGSKKTLQAEVDALEKAKKAASK